MIPDRTRAAGTRAIGLRTDAYELTMLDATLRSGTADVRAVFEVFTRGLPDGYGYGIVAGLGRLVDELQEFRFGDDELEYLAATRLVHDTTLDWLGRYRFTGSIDAYREGETFFPFSPVLTVEAGFGEAVVLETIVLSVLNHDSAVASGASRMVDAAAGRTLIEGGSRRTHEDAAVAAARAAYIAGFASTSNLEAGRRYGIPTAGTAAHAFTLVYPSERDAFAAQVAALGPGTTLLVDTFDVAAGIRTAVDVAGPGLGAVRIDSGDLATEVPRARALLDELGATRTRIVASGDLDEHAIARLRGTPVDTFLVGTKVVLAPTPGFVYKLVAVGEEPREERRLRGVAKLSVGKASTAGKKRAFRFRDPEGHADAEHLFLDDRTPAGGRPLQVRVVTDGVVAAQPSLEESRAHASAARAELPDGARDLSGRGASITATVV
ncbi:MAG TPA: nicotinate phosphoribosyltransferase [Acidimicrobiia bacterium]|nr:nicotinate phosphoribosyltransferase [Acidimicrobiia bacterium]